MRSTLPAPRSKRGRDREIVQGFHVCLGPGIARLVVLSAGVTAGMGSIPMGPHWVENVLSSGASANALEFVDKSLVPPPQPARLHPSKAGVISV